MSEQLSIKDLLLNNLTNFDYIDWHFSNKVLPIHLNIVSIRWECNYYLPFTYKEKLVFVFTDNCKEAFNICMNLME